MLIAEELKYFHGADPLTFREKDSASDREEQDLPESSIPSRYRNGCGGIDLEQVRRDQQQARKAFVRAVGRKLQKLWRRH